VNKLKRKILIAIVALGLCAFGTWLYLKPIDISTFSGFVKKLEQNDYKVEDVTKDYSKKYSKNRRFPANQKVVKLDRNILFISIETNKKVNAAIEKDKEIYQNPLVDFIGEPHLYRKGNLLVSYFGDDKKLLKTLKDVLGKSLVNYEPANQQTLSVSNISMKNKTIGWMLKGNKTLRTVDGGKTWNDVSLYSNFVNEPNVDEPNAAVCFYDNNTAWVSLKIHTKQDNKVAIYHTICGGKKWNKTLLPITEDWEKYGTQYINFIDSLNGFILNTSEPALGQMNKAIYKTKDGGKNWLRVGNITNQIDSYPTGIAFRNSKEGWITASNHGQNYILTFKTEDGGYSWHKENLQMVSAYKGYYTNSYPPAFLDNEKKAAILPIEYAKDESRFIIPYLTSDGGHTWNAVKISGDHTFSCFDFINEKQWFAINTKDNKLYETNTGGNSWTEVSQNKIFKGIKTLDFTTTQIGWATGDNIFIRTNDGGRTWNCVK
jgi:photosystem II stability/assembly factor-like uncharacterized protein/uncharacterized protein YxeA